MIGACQKDMRVDVNELPTAKTTAVWTKYVTELEYNPTYKINTWVPPDISEYKNH